MGKPKIVISAINFFEGGPLSVLKDCLRFLTESSYVEDFEICALVHKTKLFEQSEFSNVTFIEFPSSRKSYLHRLYYEYFYFKGFAKENRVVFWFSLHDITPRLKGVPQAVYCHNPSPFRTFELKNLRRNPTEFFFNLFYKYLYRINLKSNKYVVVQQQWIRERFTTMFSLTKEKIVVSTPNVGLLNRSESTHVSLVARNDQKSFIYPTLARSFKNIEVLGEAVSYIQEFVKQDFRIYITIDGTENEYANAIVRRYGHLKQLVFIGKILRSEVYDYYGKVDALLFPSTLETWGMPITEFKEFNKPIVVANLPYAKETVSDYEMAIFFDPEDYQSLAHILIDIINEETIEFSQSQKVVYEDPHAEDWSSLFNILLS